MGKMREKLDFQAVFWVIFLIIGGVFACITQQKPGKSAEADGGPVDFGFMLSNEGARMHFACDQLPIQIIAPHDWEPAFFAASIYLNMTLQKQFFTISEGNAVLPVVVNDAACVENLCKMTTNLTTRPNGEALGCYIFVPPGDLYNIETVWWPIMHELLHALGLAHDAAGVKSIMNESIDLYNGTFPGITDEDIARLLEVYGSC